MGQNGTHADDYSDIAGITYANVDFNDRALVARVRERDLKEAGVRIKAEVARLQSLGIIDAQGRLINTELPADMREDSLTDFGG